MEKKNTKEKEKIELFKINLNGGSFALVDQKDFQYLSRWKWTHHKSGYATRAKHVEGKWKTIYMHREVLTPGIKCEIDHINKNRLDNRSVNLRSVPRWVNCQNRKIRSDNNSGILGIWKRKDNGKWTARIVVNGIRRVLGCFLTKEEAGKAYEQAKQRFNYT